MSRIFLSPNKYIQGAGTINIIGVHAAKMGRHALLVGGTRALHECASAIQESLGASGVECWQEPFGGECCDNEIARLVSVGSAKGADIVIAAGGGKVIDTGKMVADQMNIPVIVVPTIAATDAPCSAGAVIYTEDGVFERAVLLSRNPDCVLVDTAVVAQAPVKFLVSGMGDALATFWEADTCNRSSKPNFLTGAYPPTLSAMSLARLCYDTLLEYGLLAKLAVEKRSVTPAVEAIVEANILLSGIGFESGGLAAAHSIHNGFTVLQECHHVMHGQKVAFGTLVQMVMEGRPADATKQVLNFCLSVGLPVCLSDLGVEKPTAEGIRKVAEASTAEGESIHSTWFPVTAGIVEAAIWAADSLGSDYRKAANR